MKVFLTGGNGFIGKTLLRDAPASWDFVVMTSKQEHIAEFTKEIERPNITVVPFDYAINMENMDETADKLCDCLHGVNAVVHMGFTRPLMGGTESIVRYIPSILLSEALIDGCLRLNISNFVFLSTISVYKKSAQSNIKRHPHTEDERIEPNSLYASAKACVENMGMLSGLSFKSLRLSQVMGHNEYQGILSTYLHSIKNGQPLLVYGSGEEISKEYVYVRDVARAVVAAVEHPDVSGIFNIGTGTTITINDLAQELLSAFGKCPDEWIKYLSDKCVPSEFWCMSNGRARMELGWSPYWGLNEAIQELAKDVYGRY